MCKSEDHERIVAVSKSLVCPMTFRRRRATDCKLQVPDHQQTGREKFVNPVLQARRTQARCRATDCISHVSRHRETVALRFQSGFKLSKKACLMMRPISHNVAMEQPTSEPKKNTCWYEGELRRRVNRSSFNRK